MTYSVSIDGDYAAYDHGLEYFTGTEQAVYAQTLYGANLKNKLERDVLTISQQTLTSSQQTQVRSNIGAAASADLGSKSSASGVTGNDAFSKISTLNSKMNVYFSTLAEFKSYASAMKTYESVNFCGNTEVANALSSNSSMISGTMVKVTSTAADITWASSMGYNVGSARYNTSTDVFTVNNVNSKIANSSTQITVGTGALTFYKFGRVVFMNAAPNGVTADVDETFATVPEGYRPADTVNIIDAYNISAGRRILVSRDGNVTCKTALSSSTLRFTATWLIPAT